MIGDLGRRIGYFLALLFAIGWVASIIWQLRLSQTEGKVLSRNGYVHSTRNPVMFEACVAFFWFALIWGTGLMIAMAILAINQLFSTN